MSPEELEKRKLQAERFNERQRESALRSRRKNKWKFNNKQLMRENKNGIVRKKGEKDRVSKSRAAFKRMCRSEGRKCEDRYCREPNTKPGEPGTTGAVAEHIVAASRNPEIACDFANMVFRHGGCCNLDDYKSDEFRFAAILMHYPHRYRYARENMKSKIK